GRRDQRTVPSPVGTRHGGGGRADCRGAGPCHDTSHRSQRGSRRNTSLGSRLWENDGAWASAQTGRRGEAGTASARPDEADRPALRPERSALRQGIRGRTREGGEGASPLLRAGRAAEAAEAAVPYRPRVGARPAPVALRSAILAQVGGADLEHRLGAPLQPELLTPLHPPVHLLDRALYRRATHQPPP